MAQAMLVVDTLNFCFWPEPGLEYEHLARGVKSCERQTWPVRACTAIFFSLLQLRRALSSLQPEQLASQHSIRSSATSAELQGLQAVAQQHPDQLSAERLAQADEAAVQRFFDWPSSVPHLTKRARLVREVRPQCWA